MKNTIVDDEGWESYRKLVTDTLRRLDERTSEIHSSINHLTTRVSMLEKSSSDGNDEVEIIHKELIDLRVDFFKFKTKIESDTQAADGVKENNHIWIGGIWAVIAVVISSLLGPLAESLHLFGG